MSPFFDQNETGPEVAIHIFMMIVLPIIAVGAFWAVVIHRLKVDREKEKHFRSQLTGIDLEKTRIPLA